MTTQRLPGTGKRVLSPVVLGCLWAFALPADARAQNPGFTAANCNVQSGVMNGAVYWQIQGTATVSNLPMGMTTVNVKVQFQKKAAGQNWANLFALTQVAAANNGTAMIGTGNQPLDPAPNKGDQYRIVVTGSWSNGGPPPQMGNLKAFTSDPVTPLP